MAHPGGRPTDYSHELAVRICDEITISHEGLQEICDKNEDFPAQETTVYKWMRKYPEFRQLYLEAKELQGVVFSNHVMRIVLNCPEINESIAKANLILRTAQWHLSKLAPKQFGDKKEQVVNVSVHEKDLESLK